MGIYKATPGSTVLGANIMVTLDALVLYKEKGYQLLAQVGISDPKEDEWYDMQSFCDLLDMLKQDIGPATLFLAGRNIGVNAKLLPPHLNTPEKVLASFDELYKIVHKGIPADQGWKFISTGSRSATMICTSPYPDELQRGVCDGFVRRFKTGTLVVKIDGTKPRVDTGGKSVTFHINW